MNKPIYYVDHFSEYPDFFGYPQDSQFSSLTSSNLIIFLFYVFRFFKRYKKSFYPFNSFNKYQWYFLHLSRFYFSQDKFYWNERFQQITEKISITLDEIELRKHEMNSLLHSFTTVGIPFVQDIIKQKSPIQCGTKIGGIAGGKY